MNLEQVAHFVSHPHELTLQDAEALRSLTAKYPFSSVYPLLYLTALSNGKSPDLDLALQQHAFKLSDRTKLYYLLTQSSGLQSPVSSLQSSVEVEELEVGSLEVKEPVVEPEIVPKETAIVSEEVEAEIAAEEPVAEETEEPIDADLLDFDQLTEAFTLEQHFEVGAVAVDELRVGELPVDEFESSESDSLQSPAEVEQLEVGSLEVEAEEKPVTEEAPVSEADIDDKKSFTSWLKSGQQQHVQAVPQEEMPKKLQASELIDKFIEEEPSISRGKTDFYSPSKKAKESLNEDAVPVSETLAKIYAAQGNYPKAIHVYHQLMLSVPEKKAFFAIQIDELKKKITP